jgi:predicted AAA+ superfamily ATPase
MIDKSILFRIFEEREEKFNLDIINRQCEKEALKFLRYKEILAITGVRRCGKTYLLYYLMSYLNKSEKVPKENILYINFEDERLAFIEPKDLDTLYEWFLEYAKPEGKLYFFLDEIQNVPLWEKWLSRIYEKVKLVVTGSNSTLLSSEIATALTGRSIELQLRPFSFSEYVAYKEKYLKKSYTAEFKAKASGYLEEFIELGGFPEVLIAKKIELLSEYYKAILLRDIISRYSIKHRDYVEKISLYLLSNLGKPVSLYSLIKDNPLGINTIKNYLLYMERCFLLSFVKKFDYSLRKQNANPRKVYCVDPALARQVSFKFTQDRGRIIENIIFNELQSRNKEVYYFRRKNECDFVIKDGLKIKEAIQVCYEFNEDNRERELGGLREAMEKFNLKKGIIINYAHEELLEEEGMIIAVIPLWKWLLEE